MGAAFPVTLCQIAEYALIDEDTPYQSYVRFVDTERYMPLAKKADREIRDFLHGWPTMARLEDCECCGGARVIILVGTISQVMGDVLWDIDNFSDCEEAFARLDMNLETIGNDIFASREMVD